MVIGENGPAIRCTGDQKIRSLPCYFYPVLGNGQFVFGLFAVVSGLAEFRLQLIPLSGGFRSINRAGLFGFFGKNSAVIIADFNESAVNGIYERRAALLFNLNFADAQR